MRTDLKYFIKARLGLATLGCILMLIPFIIAATNFTAWLHPGNVEARLVPKLITLTAYSRTNRTIELRGSLIARSRNNVITDVIFTIASTNRAEPLKLTNDALSITYRDQFQKINHLAWSKRFQGNDNHDNMLDPGELVQITVPLSSVLTQKIGPKTPFVIDVIPAGGTLLSISRTAPVTFEPMMDLN
jgi:archaellin